MLKELAQELNQILADVKTLTRENEELKIQKKIITGIGTNNNIKIKYINNDIRDSQGNVFTPVEEIHDNVEITVE